MFFSHIESFETGIPNIPTVADDSTCINWNIIKARISGCWIPLISLPSQASNEQQEEEHKIGNAYAPESHPAELLGEEVGS